MFLLGETTPMLPEFDDNGNLPPGIHRATVNEVVERFAALKSRKRRLLDQKLRAFFGAIETLAIGMYIDGSYVSSTLSPKDVDILVILPSDFVFDSPEGQRLYRFQASKRRNHLHVFAFAQGRHDGKIDDMLNWFSKDRDGNRKGLIYVEVRS